MPLKLQDQSKTNTYLRTLLILIAGVISIFFLRELRNIFIPLFLSIFFVFLFGPMVSFLSRKKVPNFVIIILLLIIVTVVLFLLGTIIYASVSSFVNEFPKYQDKLIITFNDIMVQLKIPLEDAQYFFKDKVIVFICIPAAWNS